MTQNKNQHNSVPPSYEDLKRLYVTEGLSCVETGEALGFSGKTAHVWLVRYGLNRTKKQARQVAKPPTYTPEGLHAKQAAAAAMRERLTEESFAKISVANRGHVPANKGNPWTSEQRRKIEAQRADPAYRQMMSEKYRGEKSPNWKGGIKSEVNRRLDTAEWRRTRKLVYARDNWICQDCKCKCKNSADSKNDGKKKIQAHHIMARRDGGSDELSNLVTLCMSCHHRRERLLVR